MNEVRLIGNSGRQREPLTTRLRNLIGDYPRSIGILKEFIQNADDAGATVIKFIADWRTHPSQLIPADSMRKLMGPALMIYNNAEFSNEDFQAIQDIGRGSKSLKAAKTGRFGLGFNVAYNLTDYPSFISGALRKMQFFDPHEKAIPPDNENARGGCNYPLDDLWKVCPDTLKPFEIFGFSADRPCNGTVFRLPFRTLEQGPDSQICQLPFTKDDFDQITHPLYNTGGELLIFLKNVLEIQILEILPGEEVPIPLITIKTVNTNEVVLARNEINQFVLDDMQTMVTKISAAAHLPNVTYHHKIQVANHGAKHSETWLVANGLYKDSADEIVSIMSRMLKHQELNLPWAGKALPWGGVACKLDRHSVKDIEGKVYCFLPLPEKSGLPFHINGYFDLNSNRQGITADETLMGPEADRYLWNKLLIKHVIAQVYAQLLIALAQEIGLTHIQVYYSLWPDVDRPLLGVWNDLITWIYRYMETAPAILTGLESKWQSIKQVRLIPAKWDVIRPPLVADGVSVAEPALPEHITSGFSRAGISLIEITPQFVRDRLHIKEDVNCTLENAPRKCLRKRQWVVALLKFCAQQPLDDGEKLRGLPLLLLCDGKLHTIGNYKDCKYVMIHSTKEERDIFKKYPEWFVDPEFAEQAQFTALPKVDIKEMSPALTAINLSVILKKINTGQSHSWNPNGNEIPNSKWLTKVIRYLTNKKAGLKDSFGLLKEYAVIPDQNGNLWRLGDAYTPLVPNSDENQDLLDALQKLIPIVSGPLDLVKATREFAESFDDLIWFITPRDLVDVLDAFEEIWDSQNSKYNPKIHGVILDYFASDSAIDMLKKENRLEKLHGLNFFPLQNDEIVSGNEPNVFIPSVKPPQIAGNIKIVETGPSERWRKLLICLNFPELDLPNLIYRVIEAYQALSTVEQVEALQWIRSNLDTAEDYLDKHKKTKASDELRKTIADAELIICTDQNRHSGKLVYNPDNPIIHKVFGQRALIPDMKIYKGNKRHWLEFFKKLGMVETPRAQDLLDYIDVLIASAQTEDIQSMVKLISNVFFHIRGNWDVLSKFLVDDNFSPAKGIPFPVALKKRAWLPARYTQTELKHYPGALIPDIRLYQANELALPQNAHRVASQQPILSFFGESFPGDTLIVTALGFVSTPALDVVLRHFNKLLEIWKTKPIEIGIQEFEASLRSIYQFLGTQSSQREFQLSSSMKETWKEIPCIWDFRDETQGGKRFWKPKHVFKEQASWLIPHRIQFSQVPEAIDKGFDTLGRLTNPQFNDFVDLLKELSEKTSVNSLGTGDCILVCNVLRQIAIDPTLALHDISHIPLLTTTNQLIIANQVLFNNDPWIAERLQPGEVFLLHDSVPQELIRSLNLGYLSDAIDEILLNAIPVKDDARINQICKTWEKNIHSAEFLRGIMSLIKHYGAGIIRPNALGWLSNLIIEAASQIQVELVVKNNQIKLKNSAETGGYFDEKKNTIYLKNQQDRLMEKNLAKIINKNLDENRLPIREELAILLSTQPDRITHTLSDMRIRPIPENMDWGDIPDRMEPGAIFPDDSTDPEQVEGDGNANNDGAKTPYVNGLIPEVKAQEKQENTPQIDKGDFEKNSEESKLGFTGEQVTGNKGYDGSFGINQGRGVGPHSPRIPTGEDIRPPTQPGDGKSSVSNQQGNDNGNNNFPSTEAQIGNKSGRQPGGPSSNERIFISGVYKSQSQEFEQNESEPDETSPRAKIIGNQGEERVFNYEKQKGYKPERMPEGNPGYDIKVYSADGLTLIKYIEVKGIDGSWGAGGVNISSKQYEFGEMHPDKFWLYVVENALDDDIFCIHPIKNPISQITRYRFDYGWKVLAQNDPELVSDPKIGMNICRKTDQRLGEIIDIKGSGEIKLITIRFVDGQQEQVVFNPDQMELNVSPGE